LWDEKHNSGACQTELKQGNLTEHNEDECYVFMARNKEVHVNTIDRSIDSRVSRHFTNIKDWCLDFTTDKTSSDSCDFWWWGRI
jgi:hypothetical protein